MKILLDMNIPLKYATLLANKGIESIRWSDVGLPNAKDTEIIAYASEHNCIVLTYDLGFSTILAITHELKPSVVQIRASVLQAEQAVGFMATALLQNENELEKGAVMSIDLHKSRLRLLPL